MALSTIISKYIGATKEHVVIPASVVSYEGAFTFVANRFVNRPEPKKPRLGFAYRGYTS